MNTNGLKPGGNSRDPESAARAETSSERPTVWDRLMNMDRRYYYLLLAIVVAWPIIQPWGLPIAVTKETRSFFEAVNDVPSGGIIALAIDYRSENMVEMNPMVVALFHQAMKKGSRIVIWAGVDEGAGVVQNLLDPISSALGKVYGTDWINLGYKPGGDITLKKMVDDFWEGAAYSDFFGKPLEQYPIMQDFTSLRKADLLINICGVTPGPHRFIQMVTIPTGVPMAIGITSIDVPVQMPYFASGQYKGLLAGLRGAAEYEFLVDVKGPAIAGMDSQSAAHILVVGLIILSNASMFLAKKRRTLPIAGQSGPAAPPKTGGDHS